MTANADQGVHANVYYYASFRRSTRGEALQPSHHARSFNA
jgi:hypothetical protein